MQMLSFNGEIGRRTWWQYQIASAFLLFALLPWLTDAINSFFYWITPPPKELTENSVLTPTVYPTLAYLLTYPLTLGLGGLGVWIGFVATVKRVRHAGRSLWWSSFNIIADATNFLYVMLVDRGWPEDGRALNPVSIAGYTNLISIVVLIVICGVLNGNPAKNHEADG